jgi:hypothetical protein
VSDPIRTCLGCGRKASRGELVRFTAPQGVLALAPTGPGRGAYTCPRPSCFARAAAVRAFSRTLRRNVTIPTSLKPFGEEG